MKLKICRFIQDLSELAPLLDAFDRLSLLSSAVSQGCSRWPAMV